LIDPSGDKEESYEPEVIGAVGGIIGAFAVVITLLHLARETGMNARAVDATSLREVAQIKRLASAGLGKP
jgi:hypothetical protein